MQELTLREIAARVGGRVEGDGAVGIRGLNGIREARPGDITFLANGKYHSALAHSKAAAVVLSEKAEVKTSLPVLRVKDPDLTFAKIAHLFTAETSILHSRPDAQPEIHPTAVVHKSAKLGGGVRIGAYAVVEAGSEIGDCSVLSPHVYVGQQVRMGQRCFLHPHVVVRERSEIGHRVILHPGVVVGADGFGYVMAEDGSIEKIPQLGIVVLEDDVEIGANSTIDRARFDKTVVGRGTKIDNLVQIAHNVTVGEHSIIAAQTGIAGSTKIGRRVIIGGQAGIAGHLEVGDGSKIGAQAGVTKSCPPGSVLWGTPARSHRETLRDQALMKRVPELFDLLRRMTGRQGGKGHETNQENDREAR